jgi:putative redox protein
MVQVDIALVQPGFGFEATDASGLSARFDTSPDHGGQDFGIRPMQSLLMALGTCSGIDVVSILQKMRQEISVYTMQIKGEREHDKVPALWKNIHMVFRLGGTIEEEKAKHAISLSIEKYCSVAETLRRAGCVITWELELIPVA